MKRFTHQDHPLWATVPTSPPSICSKRGRGRGQQSLGVRGCPQVLRGGEGGDWSIPGCSHSCLWPWGGEGEQSQWTCDGRGWGAGQAEPGRGQGKVYDESHVCSPSGDGRLCREGHRPSSTTTITPPHPPPPSHRVHTGHPQRPAMTGPTRRAAYRRADILQ